MRKNETTRSHHKIIGISIIVLTLSALIVPMAIAYMNSPPSISDSQQQSNANVDEINACLEASWDQLQLQWPDGETKDINTGHRLTTAFYNDQLDCFARYNQDGIYDTDIQRLNDRKSDELSSYQTQSQANAERQINRTTCISSAVGSTAYTNCY